MFIKTAQHPVHYVFGVVTHTPLVFQAWALEDFSYKMRWLLLYVLSIGSMVGLNISGELGLLVGFCVTVVIGFMGLPAFMATKGDGSITLRFSNAYANAILAWHGFFVSFYLYMMIYAVMSMMLSAAWTPAAATVFLSCVTMLYFGFSLQMAASSTKKVPQWVVPLVSALAATLMYVLMSWNANPA